MTSKGGHCHYMGGEFSGPAEIIGAVAERVEQGADIIKVMASGGANTPGTDVMRPQFNATPATAEQAGNHWQFDTSSCDETGTGTC